MKRVYIISLVCAVAAVVLMHSLVFLNNVTSNKRDKIKVGFVYVGDSCNTYTNNFISAQKEIELEFGDAVETIPKYNVPEGKEESYIIDLVNQGCDLIFTTSYGYGATAKEIAKENPDIQFCIATCSNANEDPLLPNVHNYMGEIYQGRYVSGVVAGMKLEELIKTGKITPDQARIGYVAAFPYAEVISGYTAFLLGARSVVPDTEMTVVYTNSWGDYNIEKRTAQRLIEEGCVIISQHSDTAGPAVACEEAAHDKVVYHVGYNQSMANVAPTTSLISSRINWQHYMVAATKAVLNGKQIEKYVSGNVHGNDVSGGFKEGWISMLRLNDTIAAPGTQEKIDELIAGFKKGSIEVFKGNYTGVDPFNPDDTIDLSDGYIENEHSSAPTFHYVLKDIITVEE